MNGAWWWLVERVSRALEPDEREAVRGDFAESGESGGQALRGVLGLVVRRQAALWKDWRPWIVLMGSVPIGMLLTLFSWFVVTSSSTYLWLYFNNWTWGYLTNAGARVDLLLFSAGRLMDFATLACWSWTGGLLLGWVSRRTAWVNAALFCLLLSLGALAVPMGRYSGPVFSLTFYRVVYPLMAQAVLVAVPSFCGIVRPAVLSMTRQAILWTFIAAITALDIQQGILRQAFRAATIVFAQNPPRNYPQWRGLNRDGAASGFIEPKSWPEKLTRRWKVDVGEGYATPIVIGSTVYAFTRRDGKEVMLALNAATGKILWETAYPAPYKMSDPTKAHGEGPKATPLFHRGRLYTLGVSGVVSAFDATTGKLAWQKPAPAEQPFFGAAASPVGENGLVIVHPGNYGPLTAFYANTGEVKWKAGDDGAWASPIVVDLGGIRQVVSMTQHNIVGVAVEDAAVLWTYPWSGQGGGMQIITPILYGDTIIVTGFQMGMKALRPLRRDGKWVAELAWETKDISMFMSNPVVVGDALFGMSEKASGQFFAVDARTGKTLWLGPPRTATNTAVVKAGGLLFLLKNDAELVVARSSRTGFEPLKTYTVADSATWAQPAISGNRIFVKDVSSLALWTLD